MALPPLLVHAGLERHARRRPQDPALTCRGRTWTYGELGDAVRRCAAGLARLGLRPGERVAIGLPNCAEYLIAFLAAASGGWVAVTVGTGSAGAAERAAEAAAGARLLVTTAAAAVRRPAGAGSARLTVVVPCGPSPAPPPDALAWSDLIAGPAAGVDVPAPEDPFYIGFTSGSTGRPKGVVRQHQAWASSFAASDAALGLGAADRLLVAGPLGFSANLYFACSTLNAGGVLLLRPRFEPGPIRTDLATAATAAFLVPSVYRALVDRPGSPAPGVRRLISCGEKLDPRVAAALRERYPGARVLEFYGSSEIGFASLADPERGDPPLSVGRAFPGVELRVRRAEDGAPAPPGEVGVLYARSPMMACGYDGGAGHIQPFADPQGWVGTGDLAWIDAAGCVFLTGRADDVINSAGAKVHPAQVEAVLAAHPAVAEAAVYGRPHPRRGMEVVAAVVLRAGRDFDPAALRRYCAERLAPHQRPRRILTLAHLPRTASGKLDRDALPARQPDR